MYSATFPHFLSSRFPDTITFHFASHAKVCSGFVDVVVVVVDVIVVIVDLVVVVDDVDDVVVDADDVVVDVVVETEIQCLDNTRCRK